MSKSLSGLSNGVMRAVLWKFTGELVEIAIDIITSRTAEFGVRLDDLRPAAFTATDDH
ncbi:hypothetical protein [Arthrobacter crystallopoietes]|uniref:hypothetical protein n=1 Tax=Crystallibacter crystallopoietes TaxID=37928 RepID=UPI0013052E41|nr:hypothetical protein [Arthrobacter crystallopoietes]